MVFLLTILCSETQIQTQKFSYQNNLAKVRIIFSKYKIFNNNLTLQHPTIIIYNHLQNRQKSLPVALEGPKIGKKPAKIYKIIRLLFHPVFSAQNFMQTPPPSRPPHPCPNRQRNITPIPRPPPQLEGAIHPTPPSPAEGEKQMLNWAYPYQSPLA